MYKLISLFLFLSFFSCCVYAQNDCYTVMKIKGKITLESSGNALKEGDLICGKDKILFNNADAVAVVYSTEKGRFTLKPGKKTLNELTSVITTVVSDALFTSKKELSYKSNDIDDEIDLITQKKTDKYFIIDKIRLPIPRGLDINEDNYFVLLWSDGNTEQKIRLSSEGSSITIQKASVFENSEEREIIDARILYYDAQKGFSPFADLRIFFPNSNLLKEELEAFLNNIKNINLNNREKIEWLSDYCTEVYGETDKEELNNWINNNLINKQ